MPKKSTNWWALICQKVENCQFIHGHYLGINVHFEGFYPLIGHETKISKIVHCELAMAMGSTAAAGVVAPLAAPIGVTRLKSSRDFSRKPSSHWAMFFVKLNSRKIQTF